jgi:hypothetical protein
MCRLSRLPILLSPLLLVVCSVVRLDASDARLMTDTEYKTFLVELEAELPQWEQALKGVDPAKTSTSYAVGKRTVQYRDIGLMAIEGVSNLSKQERSRRSVTREFLLRGSLEGVMNAMEAVLISDPSVAVPLESYAPELSRLNLKLANDLLARVELLERGTCP